AFAILLLTLWLTLPCLLSCFHFFFFNPTAPPEIYTLSLHDALPILLAGDQLAGVPGMFFSVPALAALRVVVVRVRSQRGDREERSEEHTSELQSRGHLVCRLLLEKKKK